MSTVTNQQKQRYYLLTGEVVYILPEDKNQQPVSIRVNGVVAMESDQIPLKLIGRATGVINMNFLQRTKNLFPNPPHIVDTVITNMVYLGHFTHDEFYKDMKVQTEGPVTKA